MKKHFKAKKVGDKSNASQILTNDYQILVLSYLSDYYCYVERYRDSDLVRFFDDGTELKLPSEITQPVRMFSHWAGTQKKETLRSSN